MINHVSDKAEFDKLIKGEKVLVDFFASWCGPCSMLAPLVEKVAKDDPTLTVIKVDVDSAEEIAAAYDISSIPTLIFFSNGVATKKSVGYIPEASLRRFAGIK